MTIFGLTGGIASGKSFVASLLAERGAVVLDADRHAHAVLNEFEVIAVLRSRWGDSVVGPDGLIRRDEVAKRVFGGSKTAAQERYFLEAVVHPRVRERLQGELRSVYKCGAPAAVLDIPLLLEAGWADTCDAVLFVETPDKTRRERAAERGWSAEDLASREAAQAPVEEKKARADAIVPGNDETAARAAIEAAWQRWVGAEPPAGPS